VGVRVCVCVCVCFVFRVRVCVFGSVHVNVRARFCVNGQAGEFQEQICQQRQDIISADIHMP
jgi:hypothetical protein